MFQSKIYAPRNRGRHNNPKLKNNNNNNGDEENQMRASNIDHPHRKIRKSDFQTVMQEWRSYINNDRDEIELTIDSEEGDGDHSLIGSSVLETLKIHSGWITRLIRFLAFYAIGIIFYSNYEGWDFQTCVYFITQTVATVGYGNITPSNKGSQVFTIFYIYGGILVAFSLFSEVSRNIVLYMRSHYKKPIKLNKFQVFVRNLYNCGLWMVILGLIPLFGTIVFRENEGYIPSTALYFSVVTATSVGYGDIQLSKDSSIWFNVFYILVSVSLTALALEKISSFKRHLEEQELWQILEGIELSKPLIDAIKPKEAGRATSAEYILHMLQLEGKINYTDDILRWKRRFEEFDLNKDGYLTLDDVAAYQDGQRRQSLADALKEVDNSAEEVKGSDPTTGRPIKAKKRSILMQFTDESKEIFLETVGLKQPATYKRKTFNPDDEAVLNPIVHAKALRRASNMSVYSNHSSTPLTKASRRHTMMDMRNNNSSSRSDDREVESGHFPKIEMVTVSHNKPEETVGGESIISYRDSDFQESPPSSRPFNAPPPPRRTSDDMEFNLSTYSQASAMEGLFGRISTIDQTIENDSEANNDVVDK